MIALTKAGARSSTARRASASTASAPASSTPRSWARRLRTSRACSRRRALNRGGQPARGRGGRRVPRVGPRVVRHRRDHPGRRRLGREARVTDCAPTGAARYVGARVNRVEDARLLTGRGTYVDDIVAAGDAARVLRAQPVRARRDPRRSTRRPRSRCPACTPCSPPPTSTPASRSSGTRRSAREPRDAAPAARRGRGALRRRPGRARGRRRAARSPRTRPSSSTSTTSRCPRSSTTPTAEHADALVHEQPRLQRHRRARRPARVGARRRVRRGRARGDARRSTNRRTRRRRWKAAASIVDYSRATGDLTIYAATQSPHEVRLFCSRLLGMPEHRIRVVMRDTGGGFGQKVMVQRDEMCLMLAAPKVGAPVKWVEDRRENLLAAGKSRHEHGDVRDGVRRRRRDPGRVHRLRLRLRRVSRRRGRSVTAAAVGMLFPGPYRVPRAGFATKSIYTNTVGRTAYRGPWQFETLAREVLLDIAARQMGIDPVELRRRNLLRRDELPYAEPQRHDLRQHLAARDVRAGARDARLRRVPQAEQAEARTRRPLPRRRACPTTSSRRRPASATTRPRRRRSASSRRARSTCTSPAARRGTASRPPSSSSPPTRSASNIEDVNTIQGDTAVTGFGAGTAGSRSGSMTAGAMRETATILRERICRDRRAQARSRRRRHRAGRAAARPCAARPSIGISLAEIAALAYFEPFSLPPGVPAGLEASARYTADAPLDLGERHPRVHVRGRRRDRRGHAPALHRERGLRADDQPERRRGPDRGRRGAGHRRRAVRAPRVRRRRQPARDDVHGLPGADRGRGARRSSTATSRRRAPARAATRASAKAARSARRRPSSTRSPTRSSPFGVKRDAPAADARRASLRCSTRSERP